MDSPEVLSPDHPGPPWKVFPRWKDETCTHPEEAQITDGMGTICGECGILQIRWR